MPTAAKLVASILFAILGYAAAEVYKPGLPPDTQFGMFSFGCAFIGLISGWRVMGALAGEGYPHAVGHGLRTSATIAFFALVFFSIREMVLQSMKMRYDGVVDAILGAFDLMYKWGLLLLQPMVLVVLIGGGILCALITEWVSHRWR